MARALILSLRPPVDTVASQALRGREAKASPAHGSRG